MTPITLGIQKDELFINDGKKIPYRCSFITVQQLCCSKQVLHLVASVYSSDNESRKLHVHFLLLVALAQFFHSSLLAILSPVYVYDLP